MSLRVDLEHMQKLRQLPADDEAALPSLLRTAWGLVLRCYTGLDDVCFAYQEARPGSTVNERLRYDPHVNGVPFARVTVGDGLSIGATLAKIKDEYLSDLPYQASPPVGATDIQLFDTAVVLRRIPRTSTAPNPHSTPQPLSAVLPQEVLPLFMYSTSAMCADRP